MIPPIIVVDRDVTSMTPTACALGDHAFTTEALRGPGPTRVLCACGRVTVTMDEQGNIDVEATR